MAGTGSQSFSYDPLHRVTGSTISGGPSQIYTYDANSNRLSWNDGTATTTYDYNEADELTAQHRSGVDRTYAYDAYGNMTSSAVASSGATSYTYDAQDRVKSLTPPSGGALTFTLDALGRHWTKSVGGTLTDTYGYIGASEAIARIDLASSSVSASIDAMGNRVATATSAGGFGWSLPDLHGNVAAAFGLSGSPISDAFRYSAYGTTLAKITSSLPSPWRFQGRLSLNTDDGSGVNTDLYDFVARAYDPSLAAFTSLDSVAGGAQNPLTLNRFLYALANPATLIDPTGHYATTGEDNDSYYYAPRPAAIERNRVRNEARRATASAVVRRPRLTVDPVFARVVATERLEDREYQRMHAVLISLQNGTFVSRPSVLDRPGDEFARRLADQELNAMFRRPSRQEQHDQLALAGAVPYVGAGYSGIDALLYASEGDWANALLSAAGAFPGVGLLKAAKLGGNLAKSAVLTRGTSQALQGAVHGNSLASQRLTTLYLLTDADGAWKWGMTSEPRFVDRYSQSYLADKEMLDLMAGSRSEIAGVERFLTERVPGQLNNESWAGKQFGNDEDMLTDLLTWLGL